MDWSNIANLMTPDEVHLCGSIWSATVVNGEQFMDAQSARDILECSGLPTDLLHDIWDLVDYESRGCLSWNSFLAAIRLIGHAQSGVTPSIELLHYPPQSIANLSYAPIEDQPVCPAGIDHDPWTISDDDRKEYIKIFTKYDKKNAGFVDANDAKEIFSTSDLSRETLFHIWDLADRHKRGQLDMGEFIVASHLVVTAGLTGHVPSVLPPSLVAEFDPPLVQDDGNDPENIENHPSSMPQSKMKNPSVVSHAANEPNTSQMSKRKQNETDYEEHRSGQAAENGNDDEYLFRPRKQVDFADSVNPVDLLTAVIEGDRSMAYFLKSRVDGIEEDMMEMKTINSSLVMELKEQREDLHNQLKKYQNLENEMNQLRSQYTALYSLRKEVLQQSNSITKQSKLLEIEKEFLQRTIAEIKNDIAHATGMSGDLENATKLANISLNAINGGRQAMMETLQKFEDKCKLDEAEVADLGVTLKRYEQDKNRIVDNNHRQLTSLTHGLQDHANVSQAIEKDNHALAMSAKKIMGNANEKGSIMSTVMAQPTKVTYPPQYVASQAKQPRMTANNISTSVAPSPIRPFHTTSQLDAKGVPHLQQAPRYKTEGQEEGWVKFKSAPQGIA